ncbi:MAG: hypothetical protein ACHQQ3_03880 [Gemmatimonadales bacterium]
MRLYHRQASFHRAALLLGLVRGETVVKWAEGVIEHDAQVPPPMFDVASTPPGDLTALRHALEPLADETDAPCVIRAILDFARRDLESGRRDTGDTVTILAQIRRFLTVPSVIIDELDTFQEDFMLASAGVVGDVANVDQRVRAWLAQYDGAAEVLMAERTEYVMECERAIEAAAFVAALSRFVASPTGMNGMKPSHSVEVWALSPANSEHVSLYLSQGAREAAARAFPPGPITRGSSSGERPRQAVLVLDGHAPRAMGLYEAQRSLNGH